MRRMLDGLAMWVVNPLASYRTVTQLGSEILITLPQPSLFSKAFQQAVTGAHGLIDCTAVIVCLQGKLGVINRLGINSSLYHSEQLNFLS